MKHIIWILLILSMQQIHAQELFTWSEPASNMAAKSIGFRITNTFMNNTGSGKYNYLLRPEMMWGISGKVMMHAEGFFSNENSGFKVNGGGLYFKYRFLSNDEVHSHFRMAFYSRVAMNNVHIRQQSIELNERNSGYEAGLITTKLINKVAVSVTTGFLHATDNTNNNKFYYPDRYRNAIGYSFSIGKLMLPKEYVNYKQTNLNLMLELLGQTNFGNGRSYLDLAPVAQLIIFSKMRIDASYRFVMVKDIYRTASAGFLLRFDYNIFNAYK